MRQQFKVLAGKARRRGQRLQDVALFDEAGEPLELSSGVSVSGTPNLPHYVDLTSVTANDLIIGDDGDLWLAANDITELNDWTTDSTSGDLVPATPYLGSRTSVVREGDGTWYEPDSPLQECEVAVLATLAVPASDSGFVRLQVKNGPGGTGATVEDDEVGLDNTDVAATTLIGVTFLLKSRVPVGGSYRIVTQNLNGLSTHERSLVRPF